MVHLYVIPVVGSVIPEALSSITLEAIIKSGRLNVRVPVIYTTVVSVSLFLQEVPTRILKIIIGKNSLANCLILYSEFIFNIQRYVFYTKFVPNYTGVMKYCKTTHFIFSSIIFLTIISWGCSRDTAYRNIEGFTQGTTYHIAYSPDVSDSLDSFVSEILLKVDNSLSVYNDSSVISKLNRGDSVVIDSLFVNVFNRSKEIYQISNGAFDISGAPLFDIWGFGFKNKEHVTQTMIDSILPYVGMDKVNLVDGVLVKSDKRLTLNANAIAQGYTADVIAKEFDKLGIRNYLVEIGGEIFCKGVNSKGKEWTIGIDKPVDGNMIQGEDLQVVLSLTGKGLATSGNYRKFYEEGGEKFSHTIDPKTGYPVRHSLLSATVVAKDAMTADALATFFMVIGLDKTKEFLAANEDVQAYLVYADGDKFEVFKTNGINIVK